MKIDRFNITCPECKCTELKILSLCVSCYKLMLKYYPKQQEMTNEKVKELFSIGKTYKCCQDKHF